MPAGHLRRLAGRSPRALLARLVQRARAELERLAPAVPPHRLTAEGLLRSLPREAGIRDAAHLLRRFRARLAAGPLPAFRDPEETRAAIRARWPRAGERALARASRIEAGRFDLLGYDGLDFGQPIDWAYDPVHERRAPEGHWSRVPYLDPEAVGDHKIIWELNRHQYFLDLGRAYWHDGDERWARLFVDHLTGWMEANPPKRGINWTSSLELGFRAISWLWAFALFAGSPSVGPELFARAVAWLRLHGTHVERYISTWFSPNTHLTGEALALVYLGTLLPELPEAARWRQRGRRWLVEALATQIRPDGGYFEQSTHYHRYTADFYLHLMLLSRPEGGRSGDGWAERVEALIDHLAALTRPDGQLPRIGDDDGGALLFLDDRPPSDARSTLLVAALLFGRRDWASIAGEPTEALAWMLGAEGIERRQALGSRPPRYASRALPDTGFYVTRGGWEKASDYALVRCGPHGALSAGHAHADALSIELAVRGTPLLAELGTGSYTDEAIREALRATAAHNTVTVGERSSSEPLGPFAWGARARSAADVWLSRPSFTFFRGSHDGYGRLWPGLVHRRSLLWIRDGCWLLHDRVEGGEDAPEARARFWPALGLAARAGADGRLVVHAPEAGPIATLCALDDSAWEAIEGPGSPSYGRVEPASGWERRLAPEPSPHGARELWTLILAGQRPPPEPLDVARGRGWRVADDLLLLGEAGAGARVGDGSISSDFAYLWLRPGRGDLGPRAVGLEGRRVDWAGVDALEFAEPVRFFTLESGGEVEAQRPDGSAVARVGTERPVPSP